MKRSLLIAISHFSRSTSTIQPRHDFRAAMAATGFWLVASGLAFAVLDTNNNGMSDVWEEEYPYGQPLSATADPDHDGWTNAQEAAAGTDPFSANPPTGIVLPSILHIPAVYDDPDEDGILDHLVTPEAVTVTWPTLPGKLYTLLASPDLTATSWIEIDTPRIGDGNEMGNGITLTQPGGGTADKMFWRVSIADIDSDSDSLTDAEENYFGTNPYQADTDSDGISDHNEVTGGTDPNDPDSDDDGITDGQELADGTDPNEFTVIGPVNFGFDEEITESPDMSFQPENPADLYDQSGIAGWQAADGQYIEVWKESDGSQYVELQSHWDAHGVKQEFSMRPGAKLNFILRYKGRYEDWQICENAFTLKVEGASEVLVDGNALEVAENAMSHSFMETDSGTQWETWHFASVSITAPPGTSGLKPITLSLVPITTSSYQEEEITRGGFVDLLPVEVQRDEDVEDENWQAMTGQLAKALPGERINLRVDTSIFPNGVTVDGFEWVLPEKVFKDYTTTANKGELVELEEADLNQQTVGFYFTTDGLKDVRVKFNVDGTAVEAKLKIKVEKPVSTFTTEKGVVRLGEGAFAPTVPLSLGFLGANEAFFGVKYIASVTTPDGWTDGQFVYAQLIKRKREFTNPPGGNASVLGDGVTWKHDGPFPYGTAAATFTADGQVVDDHGDSPSEAADSLFRSTIEITESFQTYLMFRPTGTASRYVPFRKIDWNWGGKATAADNWAAITDPVSAADAEGAETNSHPEWGDNATNDEEQDVN